MNNRAALTGIVAALVLFVALGVTGSAQAATTADGFVYTVSGTTATITGYTGKLSAIAIPAKIGAASVRAIAANAFKDKRGLIRVTVPSGVQTIGSAAFRGCTALSALSLPGTLTSIGSYALYGCGSMRTLTIPTGVASIGSYAFSAANSLSSIILPGTLATLGERAFYSCPSLLSARIPGSVTAIAPYTFAECHSLSSLTIGAGVGSIGASAFRNCGSLRTATFPASLGSIGADAFNGCASLGKVSLPSGVGPIGARAFMNCVSISSLTIPGSVRSIGASAFEGDYTISSVNIPQGVTSIGSRAFFGADGLRGVSIAPSVTFIGADAFACPYVTISGFDGSYAQTYADLNGIPFLPMVMGAPNMSGARWNYNAPFMFDGQPKTITLSGLPAGITVKSYAGNSATDIGAYQATATFDYDPLMYTPPVLPPFTWQIVAAGDSDARPAPAGVKVEAVTGTALKITWGRVLWASGYEIWRSANPAGPYDLIRKTAALTFSNTYLTAGSRYFYQIRSYDTVLGHDYCSGKFSAPVGGVPLARAAIQSLTATGRDSVKLAITPVPGATGYEIWKGTSATGTYTLAKSSSATPVIVTGLRANTVYCLKARAYKQIGTVKYYGPFGGYRSVKTLQ